MMQSKSLVTWWCHQMETFFLTSGSEVHHVLCLEHCILIKICLRRLWMNQWLLIWPCNIFARYGVCYCQVFFFNIEVYNVCVYTTSPFTNDVLAYGPILIFRSLILLIIICCAVYLIKKLLRIGTRWQSCLGTYRILSWLGHLNEQVARLLRRLVERTDWWLNKYSF